MSELTGHQGGNSARAQARVRSNFAPWWAPWQRCRRKRHDVDDLGAFVLRCQLRRGHLGRHARANGQFGVRFFDADGEGSP